MPIIIPAEHWPGPLLNANSMRGQVRFHGPAIKAWRHLGQVMARRDKVEPVQTPVRIWVGFRFPNNQRRDTSNLAPTCKALVDGLVDAGVLPDDCDGIIEGPFPIRIYPNGPKQLQIHMTRPHTLDGDVVGLPSVEDVLR